MAIKKEKRDAIALQAVKELNFARLKKRNKYSNWKINEEMYYGKKLPVDETRANVELGRAQEFVHTLLSKIDTPLTFKFQHRKLSQLKRVARLNSLKDFDAQRDFWDLKDLVGKKQAILYGRAVYAYHATDYHPHLENVDVYDFVVDPNAGGVDLEQAKYMGRYGVRKNKYQLKSGPYIQSVVKELNRVEDEQQKTDKRTRELASGQSIDDLDDEEMFTFWEWYTTYKGERYYLLMDEKGTVVRCEPLGELFETELFPFWTYATFPDLTEFWTPSHIDYVREIFMAQTVSINQMLDNAERVNKPQRIIDALAIQDLSQMKYKKDGYILAQGGVDVSRAYKQVEVPSIQTPIEVFNVLEQIQEKAMGVSAAEKGMADTDGRATIYEGNRQTASDRYGLLNKSYSYAYRRFASLYEQGVREHLNKKIAVDILGPEGLDIENISKRDIFRGNETFSVLVESSDAEISASTEKKRTILAFLTAQNQNPLINPKKSVEIQAKISGIDEQQIRELLDVSEYGDAETMSEADRDMEDILDGKMPQPNRIANTAYKQRMVNYINDNMEHMTAEQIEMAFRYIDSIDDIVLRNTERAAVEKAQQETQVQAEGRFRSPGPAQPLPDVIQQNS